MRATVALFVVAGLATGLALPVPTAWGQGSSTEEARLHFQKGQQFFDVGRWDEAAEEFEKAYAIRNDPTFLYNMAQSYRRKGDAKRALDLYKNYLIKAPKSPQRPEVEERIRALQKQIDEAEYAVKPPSQSPTSPDVAPLAASLVPLPPTPALAPVAPVAPAPVAPAPVPLAPTSIPAAPMPATVVYAQTAPPASAPPQVDGATPTQAVYPGAASGSTDAYSSSAAPGVPQAQPSYLQARPRQQQLLGTLCVLPALSAALWALPRLAQAFSLARRQAPILIQSKRERSSIPISRTGASSTRACRGWAMAWARAWLQRVPCSMASVPFRRGRPQSR